VEKFGKRNLKVTKEHNEDCKRLLRLLGVPVVEAPCEAEATCAELCKQGKVYAVATEDMDTLTFGSPKLAKNMMKPAAAQLPVTEISYDKALEELKLTKEQFVDMCILCGCDYTDSVRGCGPVTALKLIQEHGSLEAAMEELQGNKKYTMPESFPYQEARHLFLQPDVIDVASMPEFKWTDPDEEGLVAVRTRDGMLSGCLLCVALTPLPPTPSPLRL
jgi:flap endonuclease-1